MGRDEVYVTTHPSPAGVTPSGWEVLREAGPSSFRIQTPSKALHAEMPGYCLLPSAQDPSGESVGPESPPSRLGQGCVGAELLAALTQNLGISLWPLGPPVIQPSQVYTPDLRNREHCHCQDPEPDGTDMSLTIPTCAPATHVPWTHTWSPIQVFV